VGRARVLPSLLASLVSIAPFGVARAQTSTPNLSGYLTLASGYWKHGLAQNDGASLTAGIDYEHHTGFFTYARAANVEYEAWAGGSRDVEASVYAGFHDRRGDWSWTASVGRYFYPGTGGAYDYDELSVSVCLRDRVFYAVSWTDDYYGWSRSALNQEVSAVFPLRGDFEIGAALGSFVISDGGPDITHWNLGVSKLFERVAVDLRYYDGNHDRRGWLGDPYAENLVVSVSYALRGKRPRS
jgi:uncharacterized protein (TIGR02001 family)